MNRRLPSFLSLTQDLALNETAQRNGRYERDESELLQELYSEYDQSADDFSDADVLMSCFRVLITLTKRSESDDSGLHSTSELLKQILNDYNIMEICFNVMTKCRKLRWMLQTGRDNVLSVLETREEVHKKTFIFILK